MALYTFWQPSETLNNTRHKKTPTSNSHSKTYPVTRKCWLNSLSASSKWLWPPGSLRQPRGPIWGLQFRWICGNVYHTWIYSVVWCLCEVHTMSFLPKSIVLVDAIKRLSRRFLGMPHPRLLVGTWTGSKNCRDPTSVLARCLWHFPYNQPDVLTKSCNMQGFDLCKDPSRHCRERRKGYWPLCRAQVTFVYQVE